MWSFSQRNTPIEVIKTIWNIIITAPGGEIESTKLLKQLTKALPSSNHEICEQHIKTALREHLLIESSKVKPRSKQKPCTVYALPKWQEFTFFEEQPDFWCYECHAAGDILKCEGCLRSFHERCRKTVEEKQLELEQFVPKQKRITISSFGTGSAIPQRQSTVSPGATEESNGSTVEVRSPPPIEASVAGSDNPTQHEDEVQIMSEETNFATEVTATVKFEIFSDEIVKQEDDPKQSIAMDEEPQFVCVVRPPNRRLEERLNTPSIKPEDSDNVSTVSQRDDDQQEQVKRYCYACRLLKNSSNNAPPHVGKQELNYLLKFIIEQYKSWLPEDTFSLTKLGNGKTRQTTAWDRRTIEVCKKMLLRKPKSILDIRKEIANENYNTLDEFHVDLLDVSHNIAIIHGVSSLEYDAMMYFLADCVYDLFEIRQCPDCYRHSNEKNGSDFFARPCRTRHELVYAKQRSYQYWPAKVIRVVNNKYDVRFFGDKHLRALVDASCVKPIDTEPRSLKINLKHRGFQLATEELLKHQTLLDGPREPYAFGSGPVVQPVSNVQESIVTATALGVDAQAPRSAVVAHRMKRGKPFQSDTPCRPSSPGGQSMRPLKRRETMPRHLEAKTLRHQNYTAIVRNQPVFGSGTAVAAQQNNNTLSSNYNSFSLETSPVNSTRLPRTKQNLRQMFAELSNPNRFKSLLDKTSDPEEIKQVALKALQENEERCHRKIDWLKETHKKHIGEVKKKQWCATCELESNLPCCWNTSYCSAVCQLKHWPTHKKRHRS